MLELTRALVVCELRRAFIIFASSFATSRKSSAEVIFSERVVNAVPSLLKPRSSRAGAQLPLFYSDSGCSEMTDAGDGNFPQ